MTDYSDQRANPRFRCRCYAMIDATKETWPAHLLNISSCGALVAVLQEHSFEPNQRLTLTVEFENEEDLHLSGEIAHVKEHYIGIKCDALDENEVEKLNQRLANITDH